MPLCLRFDLDYVPWDTAMAEAFGHGEPTMVLRLLDFARMRGLKLHFFASARSLRAFPTSADAILGEGHDLDWFTQTGRDHDEAMDQFRLIGHKALGVAMVAFASELPAWLGDFDFVSCSAPCPKHAHAFPLSAIKDTEALAERETYKSWAALASQTIQHPTEEPVVIAFTPAALACFDPNLNSFVQICESALAAKQAVRTLRELIASDRSAGS